MGRSTMLALMVALPAAALLSSGYFVRQLLRFAADTPRIETRTDLDAFRAVVKGQMYAALVQIVLLGIPIVIFLVGTIGKTLRPGDFVYLLVPSLLVFIAGKLMRGVERRVQRLPVSTPELERERDSVVATWERKALPDW